MTLREQFYKPFPDPLQLQIAVIQHGAPIREIEKTLGIAKTVFLVAVMIHNFCKQFNFGPGKNMNQGQIEDLAGAWVMDFIDRKGNSVMLEELAVFFDKALDYKRKNGNGFIFDRIDRIVLEEMLDHYFENERTAAIWAMEDEIEKKKRGTPPPLPEDFRLSNEGGSAEPKQIGDLYTELAGHTGKLKLAKLIKEGLQKYGGEDAEK